MSRWRIALVAGFIALPIGFLMLFGAYSLALSDYGTYLWWPIGISLALGYGLAWYWQKKRQFLPNTDVGPSDWWTVRDQEAWKLVEARAKQPPADFAFGIEHYLGTAKGLAMELSRHYHPKADDPVASLTIPEILAVLELVAHDLSVLVEENVPGGHFLTVKDWRIAHKTAVKTSQWYSTLSNAYWLVSAVAFPIQTALRYPLVQLGLNRPLELLKQDLAAWFYAAFVHRLGRYLIELNSGRLRIGARRYKELLEQHFPPAEPSTDAPKPIAIPEARVIRVTVLGQVKAGKSSFVNALLGEQRAQTDVLPATQEGTKYELHPPGISSRLEIFDTVGYAHEGPKHDQLKTTKQLVQDSDVAVLVLHARNPARNADVQMLESLKEWFDSRPDLRMPPFLAVLTHIDLLSPAMEWAPPYDWTKPVRPKEQQISEAVAAAREQLGKHVSAIIPICAAPGKVFGVEEWFLPALMNMLDETRAVAFLRCLRAEADTGKVKRVLQQLLTTGVQAARMILSR